MELKEKERTPDSGFADAGAELCGKVWKIRSAGERSGVEKPV